MPDWDRQRSWLEEERERVRSRLMYSGQYGLDDPMRDELGELSLYDNHPADIGSELFEREKDLALRDADKLRLQNIERALAAIAAGTYGTCERCGQAIPAERLEAYPLTTMCVKCKRRDEQEHADRERPVEEALLYPGFARTDTDGTSAGVFDGEDAWQAVERFNRRSGYIHMYEESTYDEDGGIVDPVERISDEEYRDQL
ncbi:MAG: TraR/DksA C4-type zinc finger protein [Alicyclobacillaceae bacterium]|nr:TraR/DksA C4-type zinc finger protein [Alicyclobacillaceae bacterium]